MFPSQIRRPTKCPYCGKVRKLRAIDAVRSKGCKSCANRRRFERKYGWVVSDKVLRLRWLNKWHQIKRRCLNPKHPRYHRYGGRGIRLHPSFLTFPGFMSHIKTLRGWRLIEARKGRRCLDRINNESGYRPGNLRITSYRINRINQ